MKRGLLFLNGDRPTEEELARIDMINCFVVCADGAYDYLKGRIVPDVILGDFDSVLDITSLPPDAVQYPVEKDFTDGHIAMQRILDEGCRFIDIYGGFGGRADHLISNFSLLALANACGAEAVLRGGDTDVFLADRDFVKKVRKGAIVSLLPFSDEVHILYTKGLRYGISDRTLNKVHILGISNVAESEEIEYFIDGGCALVFIEK